MEIKKDAIAPYEADDFDLHTPRPKTPQQSLEAAREYFEGHYPGALVWFGPPFLHSKKIFLAKLASHCSLPKPDACIAIIMFSTCFAPISIRNIDTLRATPVRLLRLFCG